MIEGGRIVPNKGATMTYEEICHELGYDAKAGFIEIEPDGAISYSLARPDEVGSLARAVHDHGHAPGGPADGYLRDAWREVVNAESGETWRLRPEEVGCRYIDDYMMTAMMLDQNWDEDEYGDRTPGRFERACDESCIPWTWSDLENLFPEHRFETAFELGGAIAARTRELCGTESMEGKMREIVESLSVETGRAAAGAIFDDYDLGYIDYCERQGIDVDARLS